MSVLALEIHPKGAWCGSAAVRDTAMKRLRELRPQFQAPDDTRLGLLQGLLMSVQYDGSPLGEENLPQRISPCVGLPEWLARYGELLFEPMTPRDRAAFALAWPQAIVPGTEVRQFAKAKRPMLEMLLREPVVQQLPETTHDAEMAQRVHWTLIQEMKGKPLTSAAWLLLAQRATQRCGLAEPGVYVLAARTMAYLDDPQWLTITTEAAFNQVRRAKGVLAVERLAATLAGQLMREMMITGTQPAGRV